MVLGRDRIGATGSRRRSLEHSGDDVTQQRPEAAPRSLLLPAIHAAAKRAMRCAWRLTSSRNPGSNLNPLTYRPAQESAAARWDNAARGNLRNSRRLVGSPRRELEISTA